MSILIVIIREIVKNGLKKRYALKTLKLPKKKMFLVTTWSILNTSIVSKAITITILYQINH